MKGLLTIGLYTTFFIFVLCSPNKEKQSAAVIISPVKKEEKNLAIEKFGHIEFNKSFSFLQSSKLSKKEIDKLYKETEKSNPFKYDTTNESLRKRFEELGMVKDRDLLLSKFKYKSPPEFSFISQSGKEI